MGLIDRTLKHLAVHPVTPARFRSPLLKRLGVDLDPTALVFAGVQIVGSGGVTVGAHSFVNSGCVLDASAPISIGRRVALGNGAMLLTSAHDHHDPRQRAGGRSLLPVTVDDGAWIGAGAIVLPGVRIGTGVVVAAGSVVSRDCEPHGMYAGVPARRMRDLSVTDQE